MIRPLNAEDERQLVFLHAPQGGEGSGASRYAAAMYFFARGMMGENELERYRAHSKIDGISPIARLVVAAERYIRRLDFSGKSEVLEGLGRWIAGVPQMEEPGQVSTLSHLEAALGGMSDKPLAAAIRDAAPLLRWLTYPYQDREIGESFPRNHAFASLVGECGPYKADDFDLGLFLIAPHIFYRDHYHKAPELYAPLTGPHGWRFAPRAALEWRAANVPVWNPPSQPHAILVGDVPFLAFYCWTRDVNELAKVLPSPDWPQIED